SNTASAPDSSQRVSKLPEPAHAQPAGADEAAKDEAAKDETETGRAADQQETVAPETGGTHTGSTAAKQPPAPEQDSAKSVMAHGPPGRRNPWMLLRPGPVALPLSG